MAILGVCQSLKTTEEQRVSEGLPDRDFCRARVAILVVARRVSVGACVNSSAIVAR
jgi:hypothetical protein